MCRPPARELLVQFVEIDERRILYFRGREILLDLSLRRRRKPDVIVVDVPTKTGVVRAQREVDEQLLFRFVAPVQVRVSALKECFLGIAPDRTLILRLHEVREAHVLKSDPAHETIRVEEAAFGIARQKDSLITRSSKQLRQARRLRLRRMVKTHREMLQHAPEERL